MNMGFLCWCMKIESWLENMHTANKKGRKARHFKTDVTN